MRARPSFIAASLRRALILVLGAFGFALAATPQPPSAQAMIEALTRANAAVVGVQVTAAEGARSAETLGRRRDGSGVVIGPDGLILTIGYLMLEADTIQVVTQDDRSLPARAVAYDLATGFGLVKPLLPLRGINPVPLGSHTDVSPGQALMVASGGADGDVATTRLVSKRPFSGYWEYHIDAALFTSPPIPNHSGAPLFNQRGELIGIGSLFVADALGEAPRIPGNMFVPVDLLKPILAEMQQTGTSRQSRRPWLGLTSTEQSGPRPGGARDRGQPGASRRHRGRRRRPRRRRRERGDARGVLQAPVVACESRRRDRAHGVAGRAGEDDDAAGRGPHVDDDEAGRDLAADGPRRWAGGCRRSSWRIRNRAARCC